MQQFTGMILINKKRGVTSFQTIGILKRVLGIKKIGHSGILDKEAEGLLVVCIGKATRLLRYLIGLPKTYIAEIRFGSQTATDDVAGEVIKIYDGPIDKQKITGALPRFIGTVSQIPPDYSQININGKRAYKLALQGTKPEMKPRTVHIDRIDLLSLEESTLKIEVACSKGTYIRALARDLGIDTGYYAHMTALIRSEVGPFKLNNAIDAESADPDTLPLISPFNAVSILPSIEISQNHIVDVSHGRPLKPEWFLEPPGQEGTYRLHNNQHLLAMINFHNGKFTYDFVF